MQAGFASVFVRRIADSAQNALMVALPDLFGPLGAVWSEPRAHVALGQTPQLDPKNHSKIMDFIENYPSHGKL